jgi:hypothetical protein
MTESCGVFVRFRAPLHGGRTASDLMTLNSVQLAGTLTSGGLRVMNKYGCVLIDSPLFEGQYFIFGDLILAGNADNNGSKTSLLRAP